MTDENSIMEEVADRLISERVRLNYSKADFAREVGITRNTLRTYELGQSNIPSNILIRMGEIGIDIMYILFNEKNRILANKIAESTRVEALEKAGDLINSGTMNNSVIAGQGATINNINTTHHTTKTTVKTDPTGDEISNEQCSELQKLVNDIVVIESNVKRNPRSYKAVWAALNQHMKVPSYKLIKKIQFEEAKKYLLTTIGRLMASKSARKTVPNNEWRNRKYRYIHASFKEFPELEEWFSKHIQIKFDVDSKSHLSDDDLQKAYTSLSNKKRELNKKQL